MRLNMVAKLFERLTYGGECVVCGDEVPSGFPGWVIGKNCACATHQRADVEESDRPNEAPTVELVKEAPKSPADEGKTAAAILELVRAVNANTTALSGLLAMMRNVVDGGVRVRTKENEPLAVLADVRQ